MLPFLLCPEIEDEMKQEKQARIKEAEQVASSYPSQKFMSDADQVLSILSVDTADEYKKRLKLILAITQGSLEALDRVCMVICPSEDTWAKRRKSSAATKAIARFLSNPTDNAFIPWFIAERFRLPRDWRKKSSVSEIHNSLQSLYSTKYGFFLEKVIKTIVEREGYRCEKGAVDIVDQKEVDVVVPEIRQPRILIMSTYNLTTASSQSTKAREQQKMYEEVHRFNNLRKQDKEPNVQLVNVIDGGGWLSRSKDLLAMHKHCDYALATNHLEAHLPPILGYHMKQGK